MNRFNQLIDTKLPFCPSHVFMNLPTLISYFMNTLHKTNSLNVVLSIAPNQTKHLAKTVKVHQKYPKILGTSVHIPPHPSILTIYAPTINIPTKQFSWTGVG